MNEDEESLTSAFLNFFFRTKWIVQHRHVDMQPFLTYFPAPSVPESSAVLK